MKAKKLIEVAMPIKEISAESIRDKSIRHGHISTLHLWWARRPLPTCRAVVFASLVPDPLDDNCPQAFKDVVKDILCTGMAKAMYAPYPDIPYTAIYDPMEDNLRNRLLMFIGKFSDKCQKEMIAGKKTTPKEQLMDGCLIKWESKNDETVLNRARKLIYVAYNAEQRPGATYAELSVEFDAAWENIKMAEEHLYSIPNRHIENPDPDAEVNVAQRSLDAAIETFQSMMPSVFDPFAGGGAIPLEAARLGCRSYGNDINPVAHIIEKGSVEFPQKYGKPITYTRAEFMRLYGDEGLKLLQDRKLEFVNDEVTIPNRLSFDVQLYGNKLIRQTEIDTRLYYFTDEDGNRPAVYYWLRYDTCSNPSCNCQIPLLKQFYLSKPRTNRNALRIKHFEVKVNNNEASVEVCSGTTSASPIVVRGNVTCPCCGAVTEVEILKEHFSCKSTTEKVIALIYDNGSKIFKTAKENCDYGMSNVPDCDKPTEKMQPNSAGGDVLGWGFKQWGDVFNRRQLAVIQQFVANIHTMFDNEYFDEYTKCILSYLALLIDRIAIRMTSLGKWHNLQDTVEHLYGRQAIQMNYDYPELDPFSQMSSSAFGQLDSIISYIEEESVSPIASTIENIASGNIIQFKPKSIVAVVTDPPYYDAIAYADISDFFYVWLKRCLFKAYPNVFSTPQTPKKDECTALKHHHDNDENKANSHFERTLGEIFNVIEKQTSDNVSIMFAHQSTKAWTTLCNSILGANMNINSSWALDTEVSYALKAEKDTLESSVTVACTPSERKGYASYKKVKDAIHKTVEEEVRSLYELGFRGADLLTACFGKAVSVFGNYETVEKADGSEVTVAELLEMARTAAFTALVKDFASDEYTKFYIGWLHLNGMGNTKHDDVVKFVRSGTSLDISDVYHQNLLIKDEATNTQHLASYEERTKDNQFIQQESAPLIDKVHAAMRYWADQDLSNLNTLIARDGQDKNNEFWRVLFVLKELLPDGKDREQVAQLLGNADTRIEKAKSSATAVPKQASLFDDTDL